MDIPTVGGVFSVGVAIMVGIEAGTYCCYSRFAWDTHLGCLVSAARLGGMCIDGFCEYCPTDHLSVFLVAIFAQMELD